MSEKASSGVGWQSRHVAIQLRCRSKWEWNVQVHPVVVESGHEKDSDGEIDEVSNGPDEGEPSKTC